MSKDVDGNVEINSKNDDLFRLPDNLNSSNLVKLFLQVPSLTVIPPTFFECMPLLEVLDLSNTNIVSLPSSISSLSMLEEFFLRDCLALIELPTQIGMLTRLKLFDIEGTEIMYIPKEMGDLKMLEVLRVSLSEYADYYIKTKYPDENVIPRKMLSELKNLKELCICVCPKAEWWEKEVNDIQNELCYLEKLETLQWYLPTDKVLHEFLLLKRNHSPIYANVSNLMLTIGQHAQLTSCLPRGFEKKFEEFNNCLKWINAEGKMDDISKITARVEALFLSRHWTVKKLSAFNIKRLKYCLLAECNKMETLVEVDELSDDVGTIIDGENFGLRLLEYLSIHYMNELKSIFKGPIGEGNLSKLRILALHTCPELTTIFTRGIAKNLSCLIEITVEDCPKVKSLISNELPNAESGSLFPSLERIFLLDLPELVCIFGGQIILEKLYSLLIYSCRKLCYLSIIELPRIQKIKGEVEWWNDLVCDKSKWESVFEPLKERGDLVEQLSEATNSLQHFHDIVLPGLREKHKQELENLLREKHKQELENLTLTSQPSKTLKLFIVAISSYLRRLPWGSYGAWLMLLVLYIVSRLDSSSLAYSDFLFLSTNGSHEAQEIVQAILWGLVTVVWELPPYFISRAAARIPYAEEVDASATAQNSGVAFNSPRMKWVVYAAWSIVLFVVDFFFQYGVAGIMSGLFQIVFWYHSLEIISQDKFRIQACVAVFALRALLEEHCWWSTPLFGLVGILGGLFQIPFRVFFLAMLIHKNIVNIDHIQMVYSILIQPLIDWTNMDTGVIVYTSSLSHTMISHDGSYPMNTTGLFGDNRVAKWHALAEKYDKALYYSLGKRSRCKHQCSSLYETSWAEEDPWVLDLITWLMLLYFSVKIVNSTAQRYLRKLQQQEEISYLEKNSNKRITAIN